MKLLRWRKRTRDLRLPNGHLVKVEVSDDAHAQHVHDWEGRVHATARPDPIVVKVSVPKPGVRAALGRLRADLMPTNGPKRWAEDKDMGLWMPLYDEQGRLISV